MPQFDSLRDDFSEEVRMHLAEMESCLLVLEQGGEDAETINRIFRAVHTIKGTSGIFELNNVINLSHAMENLLGKLRQGDIGLNGEIVNALLAATDLLGKMLNDLDNSEQVATGHCRGWLEKLSGAEAAATASPVPAKGPQEVNNAWQMWDEMLSESLAEGFFTGNGPAAPPAKPTTGDNGSPEKNKEPAVTAGTGIAKPKPDKVPWERRSSGTSSPTDTVRVNVGLLNDLLDIAGEMVLSRNQLLRIVGTADQQLPGLEQVAGAIDRITTRLQERVIQTRMQPLANVFNKFPRIVRDLSRRLNKDIDLQIEGKTVELDKSIIEALTDPLTHLVRNAIDHGVEANEERARLDKPAAGTISLKAYHESGRVIIDITDDGAGIDIEKVKKRAIQRGYISQAEAALGSEPEIIAFIFRPGFSTAEQVTDISGRGVGLDVVKTNIEKIGGKIDVQTNLGQGTTFRLVLPLTLAIMPSLIVEAENQLFALPQANLNEFVLIQPGTNRGQVELLQGRPVLRLRNKLLPAVHLSDVLHAGEDSAGRGDKDYFAAGEHTLRILVLKTGYKKFGLAVDRVYDQEEILVKPLPHGLKQCDIFSGVTVLGDGNVAMILDAENIRLQANLSITENDIAQFQDEQRIKNSKVMEEQYILLFCCSGPEILGLDLAMVSRVEEIEPSRLTRVGDSEYIQYQGESLRVIRPESYLPLSRGAAAETGPAKLYIIIPKLVKYPVGIVAYKIIEAVQSTVKLDSCGVKSRGVLGSAVLSGQMVTLLNLYELFEIAVPEYYNPPAAVSRGRPLTKRILLVEDTPFFAKVIKGYLEWAGYEVLVAENGHQALDILARERADLIVSDIVMPVMDGIELVRTIRASERLQSIPVIALTSLTQDDQKEKGMRAGFDVYLGKLDRESLLTNVENLLSRRSAPAGPAGEQN